MKIFKKFYFWLPAVNIILIYDALNRHNNALDILAFPFIYILEAIGGMLPFLILFHFGAFNIIGYVLSSLIFYFLIGLLIDKIIYKFKKNNI
mgnify:CR=1 FL=1